MRQLSSHGPSSEARSTDPGSAAQGIGKSTLVQLKANGAAPEAQQIQEAAVRGLQGTPQPLPYLEDLQRAFGRHDLTGIQAFIGGAAAEEATRDMSADGYATRNAVVFPSWPTRRKVSHEVAHIVEQRGGLSLPGGVGKVGDPHEQLADQVADRVEAGESVEDLFPGVGAGSSTAVQCKAAEDKPAHRDAGELLEEAISVVEVALDLASSPGAAPAAPAAAGDGDAAPTAPTAPAGKQVSAETIQHLQVAHGELIKLRGAPDAQILTAVRPILQSIGAPGLGDGNEAAGPAAPVQRNTLVLGAPLLGAGPPGWVVYAVLGVGSVVVGYAVYKSSTSKRERERAISTDTTTTDDNQTQHRGRIQVQGGGLEKSFPWARPMPMTKAEALAGMAALKATLSKRELEVRTEAFVSAAKFINQTLHTCPPQVSKTFQNKAIRQKGGEERVDIEIRTGVAFA